MEVRSVGGQDEEDEEDGGGGGDTPGDGQSDGGQGGRDRSRQCKYYQPH